MKKILSLLLILAVMVGSAFTLLSCGAPEDDGAEISVYLGHGVYDLDPSDYYVSDNAAQLMSLIYEPLFFLDDEGDVECAAADDYEVDEEKRKIYVTLRETYWSDGARVTAEDYIYAWRNAILEPNNANPAAALLYDIENAVEVKNGTKSIYELGVVARVYDLEITYREGADYEQLIKNLASVATAPVRESVANLAPTYWSKSANNIVTNGPFKLKMIDYADDHDSTSGVITLERNKGYHQSPNAEDYTAEVTPYMLKSVFTVGDKKVSVSYQDIVTKTRFYLTEATLKDRKDHKGDAVVSDLASTYTYVFNTTNPLFANKNVRKALSIALDRAKIIEAITFGKAATGLLPSVSSSSLYDGAQSLIAVDAKLAEAKALLEDVDFTGIDKSFTLTVSNDEESLAIAELAKASWEALGFGFNVTVVGVDSITTTIKDKLNENDADATIEVLDSAIQYAVKGAALNGHYSFDVIGIDLQTYSTDGFVALSAFSSTMSGNGVDFATGENRKVLGGWSSAQYDKLIKEAYEATDDAVRAEKLREAEKLLIEESPVIPVVFNQSFAFMSEDLSDVITDGYGNFVLTKAELEDYQQYIKED